jgi:hypothetical protein
MAVPGVDGSGNHPPSSQVLGDEAVLAAPTQPLRPRENSFHRPSKEVAGTGSKNL